MKKILIFFFIILMCLSSSCSRVETAEGTKGLVSQTVYSEQGFDYEIQDGQIKITKCMNYGEQIVVPEYIGDKKVCIIGEEAFYQHTDTTNIKLPDTVTTIEDSAFYRCYSLESIKIPKNVISIGENPFFRCSALTQIDVDAENTAFSSEDGVLFNKDKTVLLVYPEGKISEKYVVLDSVKKIENSAFGYHCEGLKPRRAEPHTPKTTNFRTIVRFLS